MFVLPTSVIFLIFLKVLYEYRKDKLLNKSWIMEISELAQKLKIINKYRAKREEKNIKIGGIFDTLISPEP